MKHPHGATIEDHMSKTIYESFCESVSLYPENAVLKYKGDEKKYRDITYQQLYELTSRVASSIREFGIKKSDTVGIFSHNRPEWAIADLAILKLGGIVVPLYPTLPDSYVKYIVTDAKIKLMFVEDAGLVHVIDRIRNGAPHLEQVVLFDASTSGAGKNELKFDEMMKAESEAIEENGAVTGEDVATIVYTSGTTGEPKGVVLTHDNIVSNANAIKKRCRVTHEDVVVSYLPLSHMFERTCGYYSMLFAGATIAYAEDLSTLARDVATIHPTILLTVPRVIEKAYDKAVEQVERGSFIKRLLVSTAINTLNTYANLQYKKLRIPLALRVKYGIYNAFIASQFRKIAGNRLRIIASGGAPLYFGIQHPGRIRTDGDLTYCQLSHPG
jgi:long-chain acyl-CoA synthetase